MTEPLAQENSITEERRLFMRNYMREWRRKNPEKVKEYAAKKDANRQAFMKQYMREYMREWRKNNPEKVKELNEQNNLQRRKKKLLTSHD